MTSGRALVLRSVEEVRSKTRVLAAQGKRLGFVPTMGALHAGHLALVREARARADEVLVSIFVNPTQFGPNEDLARYPRDLDGDVAKVAAAGATLVFAPDVPTMYPPGEQTRVRLGALSEHLCGPFRPGHFEGVATVVTKLFAIVGPCVAVFGRKDYQQLAIVRRLVTDLSLPVEIVGHPIVREADGLAMSSRNAYLSTTDRARALGLSRGLFTAARAFADGQRRAGDLEALVRAEVGRAADSVDYVTLADADAIVPFAPDATVARGVLAVAARLGATRLIDNFVLGEDPTP
jgi:pantoate--beta-alanine ligase